ncbi:MAG: septal ring lytic transglycosylase RlpA family protein [Armatimonadetes bacterium]|nr:septal ring lytic transglycosylase RlpA family protein [Akkermansiaceae bacterium]
MARTQSSLQRLLAVVAVLCICVSCSSRPGGHAGYMTRSYTVRGQTYHPMSVEQALGYSETGICSWYDESGFFGLKRGTTSLGEKVQPWHLTGAHKTLPLPALVKVTNLENGRSVNVRINDRGPFITGRHLDVTPRAAKKLGFHGDGLGRTKIDVISIGDGGYRRKSKRGFLFW